MKICLHGRAGRVCPYCVPYGHFYGCVSNLRAMLDLKWCGKIIEECEGYKEALDKEKNNNGHTD